MSFQFFYAVSPELLVLPDNSLLCMPPASTVASRSLCHTTPFLSLRLTRAVFYRKQPSLRKVCLSLRTHLLLRQTLGTTGHLHPWCRDSSPSLTCTPHALPSGGYPTPLNWKTSYNSRSSCTWTPMSPLASTADVTVVVSSARLSGGGSCGWNRERQINCEWGWKDELYASLLDVTY